MAIRHVRVIFLALIGMPALGILPLQAQNVPQSVAPGQIERRFEVPTPLKEREAPVIPQIEGEAVPPGAENIRFTLGAVVIDGATVFPESEFVPLYEQQLASEVTLADVFKIAKAITAKYQERGYILSRAVVPQQQVSLGIVHIQVIEGYLDKVSFRGEVSGDKELLRAYAEKITESNPLRQDVLERYVLLINDLPGMSASRQLVPSQTDPGAYTLVITLTQKTVSGFLRVDNRGSRYIGPIQGWADIGFNSMFGNFDQTHLRYVTAGQPSELQYFALDHTELIGTEGTKLIFSGIHSRSEPGFTLKSQHIDSRDTIFETGLSHPLIRSQEKDLFLNVRFDVSQFQREQNGAETYDDHLRVLRAGTRVGILDDWKGRNQIYLEGSQGLSILGASGRDTQLSRTGGSPDFTKGVVTLSRYQPIAPNWAVLMTAIGQKSAQKLLLSEQLGLGGEDFGRAYDPSEIAGDDGAATRLELQRDGTLPSLDLQYEFYTYYDVGKVWVRESTSDPSLSSIGLGVRSLIASNLLASLEAAQPLTKNVETLGTKGKDSRIFFTLTRSF